MMARVGNNCNGQCSEIYPAQDGHIKQREQDEKISELKHQFCAAFYHACSRMGTQTGSSVLDQKPLLS
jgi:hypothetical protein